MTGSKKSRWGTEEQETLEAIKEVEFCGNVLNMAAGDGRFIDELMRSAAFVTAVDIDRAELKKLEEKANDKSKLVTQVVDVTKGLPFEGGCFDGVFCTGTLHLFNERKLKKVFSEVERVLKPGGKLIFDFATNIVRLDKEGNVVPYGDDINYSTEDALQILFKGLNNFTVKVEVASFKEDSLDQGKTSYTSISGNFIIISGVKE